MYSEIQLNVELNAANRENLLDLQDSLYSMYAHELCGCEVGYERMWTHLRGIVEGAESKFLDAVESAMLIGQDQPSWFRQLWFATRYELSRETCVG